MSEIRTLYLSDGREVIVDAEDYELASSCTWNGRGRNRAYAGVTRDGGTVYLHRLVMKAVEGEEYDHKNGNKLDCRKSNLRRCTGTENQANSPKTKSATSSQYKGVYFHKSRGKWCARIKFLGVTIHLGYFLDEVEAAEAYDDVAPTYFGEFARLNFPKELAHASN